MISCWPCSGSTSWDIGRARKTEHLAVHLVAGGLAGAVVKSIFSPLNAIAQRAAYLRMQGAIDVSISRVAQRMMRQHGLGAFWKGNTLNCLGCIPSKGMKFLGYEISKRILTKVTPLFWFPRQAALVSGGCTTLHPSSFHLHFSLLNPVYLACCGPCTALLLQN
mmetsp:Transcript_557/g.1688  ORF Transcript_557/g.1688 Transcript_557/m.1688 type:complete len:164 (-) Transcript_557:1377-1868(-)